MISTLLKLPYFVVRRQLISNSSQLELRRWVHVLEKKTKRGKHYSGFGKDEHLKKDRIQRIYASLLFWGMTIILMACKPDEFDDTLELPRFVEQGPCTKRYRGE